MTTFEEKPFEIESFYPGFTHDPGILQAYGKGIWPLKKDNYTMSESVNEFRSTIISTFAISYPSSWICRVTGLK